MKKNKILILGAGNEQSIAINLSKSMGLNVIAVDGNPKAPGLQYADIGIVADIKNVEEIVKIAKKFHVNGIFSHGVEIPQVVAEVAERCKLPGLNPKVAEKATDKLKRISCFHDNKIPSPNFLTALNLKEALVAAKTIGFPCVFKPIDNAGARGVIKINSINDVQDAFNETIANSKKEIVLIEEFLDGIEISTETVIYNDTMVTTGIGDRNYARNKEFEPYFVEDGHNVPSNISEELKTKIIKNVEKAIIALGIDWGVAKGDILIKDNEVFILEMAARTSGGWFCAGTVPIATGINILKPLIQMSIGHEINENDLKTKYNRAACQRYIIPTKYGIL